MLISFLTAVLTVVIPEINAQEDNEPLIFRIPDGTKENSYIGNLPQNANLDSPSNAYLRKFVIVAGDNLIKVSFYHMFMRKNAYFEYRWASGLGRLVYFKNWVWHFFACPNIWPSPRTRTEIPWFWTSINGSNKSWKSVMTGRLVNYHSSSPNLLLIFTVFMALILREISLIKKLEIFLPHRKSIKITSVSKI